MSEKQFTREEWYNLSSDIIDKLNEQQYIIDKQKIAINELRTDSKKLEKENVQLKKKLKSLQKILNLVEVIDDE